MPKSLSNTAFVTRESPGGETAHWVPNTDVYSTDDTIVIKVELAGISKDDLDLSVEGNRMTVSGMRRDEHRSMDCRFQVMEIDYGEFSTSIDVPEGYDIPRAKAAYHNGFLRIEVPKTSDDQA
jgi:HSP20 family protein